jgi:glycosyltransferase involved in cell wall biosynthesis
LKRVKKIGLLEEELVITWVGRFTDIKNPMLAIRAFDIVKNRAGMRLVMAGAGELLEE